MRRLTLSFLSTFVLLGALLAPSASQAGGEPHPLIRRAVNALQGAKTDLQDASHDYCGHRVDALNAVNNALGQLQQALQCDSKKGKNSTGEFEPVAEPNGVIGERHPNIYRAVNALGAAEGDLQNAAHDYCGHRVEALSAVQGALSQLKLALQCDKK